MQEAFTDLSARARELETKLESNVRYEKEKLLQVDEKTKELGTVEKLQAGIAKKRKTVENLTKFKNALSETQTLLRTRLIGSINDIMQDVWPELYPYGDYTGIMLEPTAEDYVLKVRTLGDPQKWEEVNAIASGGEKSIACLAMRVAFALVLVPNLKWIILDEPTHNIDQQGLGKFTKAIGEVMPEDSRAGVHNNSRRGAQAGHKRQGIHPLAKQGGERRDCRRDFLIIWWKNAAQEP